MSDEYLTTDEIAEALGATPQAVQTYFRTGSLPGRKVAGGWRTTRSALNQWIEGGNANHDHLEGTTPLPLETKDTP